MISESVLHRAWRPDGAGGGSTVRKTVNGDKLPSPTLDNAAYRTLKVEPFWRPVKMCESMDGSVKSTSS
jgi:hypothetical protein